MPEPGAWFKALLKIVRAGSPDQGKGLHVVGFREKVIGDEGFGLKAPVLQLQKIAFQGACAAGKIGHPVRPADFCDPLPQLRFEPGAGRIGK